MVRRSLALAVWAVLIGALFAGTRANARERFCNNGGRWSHGYHAGWHRYYGGRSVGYYYAPRPVYVVAGYSDPYYYGDRYYWDERPSFGLSVSFGGGGGHYRRYRPHHYRYRDYGYGRRAYARYHYR